MVWTTRHATTPASWRRIQGDEETPPLFAGGGVGFPRRG